MKPLPINTKTIAAFLAFQLPAILMVYWLAARHNPIITFVLFICAELMSCCLIVAYNVSRTPKGTASSNLHLVRKVARALLSVAQSYSPGFSRKYCRHLISEHTSFNDRGLGLFNVNRLDLRHVFVELYVMPVDDVTHLSPETRNPVGRETRNPIAHVKAFGNLVIWDYIRAFKKENGRGITIIGAPGSGKTTLLYHVLLALVEHNEWYYDIYARIPILLYLREHIDQMTSEEPPPLGALVEDRFKKLKKRLNPPTGWFERQLRKGKCLVLLDGLDEVADLEKRKKVSTWVDNQIKRYLRSCFIVTARPHGFEAAPVECADVIKVRPFNPEQVRLFIHNWYLANEITLAKKSDSAISEQAKNGAEDLLELLKTNPALNDLTINPLLLTMVVMIHRHLGKLPGSRVQLYADICQVLLERWRDQKNIPKHYDLRGNQKLTILKPLAEHMMKNEKRDISTEDAMQQIRPILERTNLSLEQQSSFLRDIQDNSGLMLEVEQDQWAFAHLSFQEFLTASYWVGVSDDEKDWDRMVNEVSPCSFASGRIMPHLRAWCQVVSQRYNCPKKAVLKKTNLRESKDANWQAA